jgi:hypothetical protein
MIIRISKGSYRPDLHAEVTQRLARSAATLVPAIQALAGCLGYWAGTDAHTNTMINVSTSSTLEQARAMATLPEMAALAVEFVALGVVFERPIVDYPVLWSLPIGPVAGT